LLAPAFTSVFPGNESGQISDPCHPAAEPFGCHSGALICHSERSEESLYFTRDKLREAEEESVYDYSFQQTAISFWQESSKS